MNASDQPEVETKAPAPESREKTQRIAEEAAQWLLRLESHDDEETRATFSDWITRSPAHVREFLLIQALDGELLPAMVKKLDAGSTQRARRPRSVCISFEMKRAMNTVFASDRDSAEQLRSRYRRALLQLFLLRRIEADAAQALLERTIMQALNWMKSSESSAVENMGGYLYRTACNLAVIYWKGEFERRVASYGSHHPDVSQGCDQQSLLIEERIDQKVLSDCVRNLLANLQESHDREVLTRLYLNEETKPEICRSLGLRDAQLEQILMRARKQFRAILRSHGWERAQASWPAVHLLHDLRPAFYVANALDQTSRETFELEMLESAPYAEEVDVWRAIKEHLAHRAVAPAQPS